MPELRAALRVAALPWAVSRVIVLGALVAAHELVARAHPSPAVVARVHQGLLGWDAGWYEAIARHGYGGAGHQSLRFFPLVPMMTRVLSFVPGVGVGAALVIVANASALAAVVVVVVLAAGDCDAASARRTAWLLCLAPPAVALVMGYSEGTFVALAAATFLALRRQRWWWAAALGVLAGLARPVGVLVAVAAAVEVGRSWHQGHVAAAAGRPTGVPGVGGIAAVAGPVAGCGAFLAYVGIRYGDTLAPLRIQDRGGLRGGFADPLHTLWHDGVLLVHGRHLGTAVHLPWVVLAAALSVVAVRRLPLSYGAFAAAVVVVAVTGANLDGFERYALSAFPLVLAAGVVTAAPAIDRAVVVLAGAGLGLSALLVFANVAVP